MCSKAWEPPVEEVETDDIAIYLMQIKLFDIGPGTDLNDVEKAINLFIEYLQRNKIPNQIKIDTGVISIMYGKEIIE